MEKQKIEIVHDLQSTSANIVWQLIGTAEGLAKWIADNVSMKDGEITFEWGDLWRHHEMRLAKVRESVKQNRFSFHWTDEDEETYVELRMERNTLTNNFTLFITDFADDDDTEWLHNTWDKNFKKLHQTSGL